MCHMQRNIQAALRTAPSDLVLKNACIVNVFSQSIDINDIAVNGDTIVAVGKNYSGKQEIDCTGLYVCPGFIDSHVHIESSMITPEAFSGILLNRGVTTVIADPHEITNVLGTAGIDMMLEISQRSAIDIFFMIPSCVPATPFEDSGAYLGAEEMKKYLNNGRVLGLGELMDVSSVINCSKELLDKVQIFEGRRIDGHCPGTSEHTLNAYLNCGVSTDHECGTYQEALEKIKLGMYVMLREGSAARNLKSLLPAVNNFNFHRFLFCTDDRHIHHLMEEGSIDNCIRLSISEGLDAIKAITIASLNSAQCYGLRDRGAVAPGYKADLVIFDDLYSINIKTVIRNGESGKHQPSSPKCSITSSLNLDYVKQEDFRVNAEKRQINLIKIVPGSIETRKTRAAIVEEGGFVKKVVADSVNKISVLERHRNTSMKSVGYIQGLGLIDCAIAQTIAHDSHNIIVAGDNDEDMATAVNHLIRISGGIVIASSGRVIDCLELPIGGLMTSIAPDLVLQKLKTLTSIAISHGIRKDIDPFLTLSFMALPVIPELKITARGLFDYEKFNFISLFS
jgi:adenine deaminase